MSDGDGAPRLTAARWRRIKGILEDVLERPLPDRSPALDVACGGDELLRADVESFLVSEGGDADDRFLETPVTGAPPAPDLTGRESAVTVGEHTRLRLADLTPYTRLRIRTRSSEYRLVVVAPMDREVVIEGGRRFDEPTRARLLGDGVVAVGEVLPLQLDARKVVTTRVRSVEVVDGEW